MKNNIKKMPQMKRIRKDVFIIEGLKIKTYKDGRKNNKLLKIPGYVDDGVYDLLFIPK